MEIWAQGVKGRQGKCEGWVCSHLCSLYGCQGARGFVSESFMDWALQFCTWCGFGGCFILNTLFLR